ncbi:site-specific integrase [Cryobacterium sp. Hh7]|uniref:tyrosine-type recombinase/integrase n=1 Tax=Cryobacterium sp. Hh7 TaxID=1259159 RepID=UPI001F5472F8|nr:site-specific integrase [Cryobacterium sp. Hh7]
MKKRSQGATKGQVRQRAKVTAKELLATGGGAWKTTSSLGDYLEQVSRPAIENAKLRPNTQTRYLLALGQLAGDCKAHSHADSLREHSIGSGTRFRALEACLKEVAKLHGTESARQARSVLSKYVLQQLNRDELIQGSPLAGMSIDLTSAKPAARKRGGQALTKSEYSAVLDFLLGLDPAEGQTKPSRGRWSLADRIAKRRNAVELTLLQATTGLRVSEANSLTWAHVETGDDGTLHLGVTAENSKTHRARQVPVLDARVAERLLTRQNSAASSSAYVIGSPADQTIVWNRDNCQKSTTALYLELSEALDIALLKTARTHLWRATLNSLLLDQVSEVVRAAFFGHDTAINRAAYTDLADTSSMVTAARRLRAV